MTDLETTMKYKTNWEYINKIRHLGVFDYFMTFADATDMAYRAHIRAEDLSIAFPASQQDTIDIICNAVMKTELPLFYPE